MEQLLAILAGMPDTVMISGVGEAAVSWVSLVDNINILVINVFAALATGGAVVAGHAPGQKNREQAGRQMALFLLYSSAVITVLLLQLAILSVTFYCIGYVFHMGLIGFWIAMTIDRMFRGIGRMMGNMF